MFLHVQTPAGVAVRSTEVDVRVNAPVDVTVTGTGDVLIAGDVSVLSGTITLVDREYQIVHAHASLDGSSPINPTLDVRITHEFRTVTLAINVSGTLAHPEVLVSSDPASFDETQLLAIFLGNDPDDPSSADRPIGDATLGLISNVALNQVSGQLRKSLPIDVLKLDPGDVPTNAKAEIGKWLTDNVLVSYRYRPKADDHSNNSEAVIQWRALERLFIDGAAGDKGIFSGDILYIWRF
jgi:translocation and assembly module TamB